MATFYKFTQGIQQKIRVYSQNSLIILKNENSLLTFSEVVVDDNNDLWLNILIDQQNYLDAGICQYQLFEDNNLKEYGSARIIPSLLVNPDQDIRNRYQIIIQSIEAQLAGTASRAQKIVKVGDKEIQYMSASQLQSLLDYFKGKLKEEQKEDTNTNTATDQMKIKYVWRLR